MSRRSRRARIALALAALWAVLATGARADRASGTWTGDAELRGNYYWERSTRVIAPAIHGTLESPVGVNVEAGFLVDEITSASVGAGLRSDVRFTETRYDLTLGAGYELNLDERTDLDLRLRGHYSSEPDYTSSGIGVGTVLALNERSTLVRFDINYVHDDVGQIFRGMENIGPDGRDLNNRGTVGYLNGIGLSLGLSQVMTPDLVGEVGYDFGYLTGWQESQYRMVAVQGTLRGEAHPDQRLRHSLYGRLAWYAPRTRTSLQGLYRAYLDSWDIAALTPEARVYQELGDILTLGARYRYYTQTQSFFYAAQNEYVIDDPYVTADPKMTEFHSHLLGAQVIVAGRFLERSRLDFAYLATADFSFAYIWNTNRYGNGVIVQAGLRFPF